MAFLLWGCFSSPAVIAADSTSVPAYHQFSPALVHKLKQNPDLHYKQEEYSKVGLGTIILDWFLNLLRKLFNAHISPATGLTVFHTIFYLLVAILLFFIIRRIMKEQGIDFSSMFRKTPYKPGGISLTDVNITEDDLEKRLQIARQKGDWRGVIELLYLKCLNKLADRDIVKLKSGKTNTEYLFEITDPELLKHFRPVSRIFDYTWYGAFEISESIVQRAEREVDELIVKISSKR